MAGIKPEPIVSESSPLKLAGAPFKPLTQDERAMFQTQVNEIYLAFTKAIASKRDVKAEALQGQVFSGEDAVQNGMADGLADDLEEMISLISSNGLPESPK
jgi:protease IV